jgi:hypothetical protein
VSDDIQTRSFDGHQFGHRWSNPPRPGLAYDTPSDPIEDHRLVACPCGRERTYGNACWSCGLAPRRKEW